MQRFNPFERVCRARRRIHSALSGWRDHIHLVGSIPPKHAVAYIVRRLKGASSHDLNQSGMIDFQFAWQRGYGALTLGETQRSKAEAYVHHQKTQHDVQTANAWLERYAEHDEGPGDVGIIVEAVPRVKREQPEQYDAWGEPPF